MNEELEKVSPIPGFDALTRKLIRDWKILKNTSKSWDLKDALNLSFGVDPLMEKLIEGWSEVQIDLTSTIEDIKEHLSSQDYSESVEKEMRDLGIPFSGEFPQYELPPFRLFISLENYEVRLSLGRKNERTSLLNPQELAKWVFARYKKVMGRKFNSTAFMKELLEAYRVANRLMYREKNVAWGRAVPLLEIYDLMTIKQAARQDYPKQFFTYDLGVLKEQSTISLDEYRFEFGFARNQSKAITIVDSLGREDRISSLTIYKEGDK